MLGGYRAPQHLYEAAIWEAEDLTFWNVEKKNGVGSNGLAWGQLPADPSTALSQVMDEPVGASSTGATKVV